MPFYRGPYYNNSYNSKYKKPNNYNYYFGSSDFRSLPDMNDYYVGYGMSRHEERMMTNYDDE